MLWLTVAEIAEFLGITPSGVRQVIRRHGVQRRGTYHYGAGLYDLRELVRHAGARDRLAS